MRKFLAIVTVLAAFLPACSGSGDAVSPGAATALPDRRGAGMLPAWPGPGDRHVTGKADQYSDYRAQNPDYYAITVPPVATFRSFLEWEDMQAVLLSYTGGLGTSVTGSMANMVVHGADVVEWWVLVPDATRRNEFVNAMKTRGLSQSTIDAKVHFVTFSADSIWMIDFGPFPLVRGDGSVAFTDFRYYHERVMDDAVPTMLAKLWGPTTYRAPMSLEGGNFFADGTGTCYTTQGAFHENPGMTEAQVKDVFRRYLGCTQVITLIPLEDGTSHIDMLGKLADPNTFVLGKGSSARNTAKTINDLESDVAILQSVVRTDGSKLTVHRIPMPYQRDNVWRTYTNSTLVNGVNLVPVYPSDTDLEAEALAAWTTAMPAWSHVGIDSDEIITWGGAMHCISRTVPAGGYAKWVADGVCNRGACSGGAGSAAGACQADADCTGPEWLCALNDCSGAAGCGDLTDVGCCDGSVVRYCENGTAATLDCAGTAGCGWNSQGYYDCDSTKADPSGTYPKACGGTCAPACTGRECGTDGCGDVCGTCPGGQECTPDGQCATPMPEPGPDAVDDPGAATDVPPPPDSSASDVPPPPDSSAPDVPAPVDAVNDGPSPDGCVPQCAAGRCGDDGCGGRCPACGEGWSCNEASWCVRDTDPRPDAVTPDAEATDTGISPLPAKGGGCAAGPGPAGGAGAAWFWFGIVAFLAVRLVYTTARE